MAKTVGCLLIGSKTCTNVLLYILFQPGKLKVVAYCYHKLSDAVLLVRRIINHKMPDLRTCYQHLNHKIT